MKFPGLITRCVGTILLTALSVATYSQNNLLPGTVITIGGDTLKGQIDYRNWGTNPDRIRFTDATGQVRVFTPIEVVRFSVKDEIYVGAVVNTENSPSDLRSLQMLAGYSLDVDTVFLQTVLEGDRALYFLKNKVGNNNFYINTNEGYELLLYKKYLANTGGQQIVAEVKGYIDQLHIYFGGNEALYREIAQTGYDWGSLERLFRHYYSLSSGGFTFSKASEGLKFRAGIFTGLSLTKIILHSDYYQYLDKPEDKPSADFTGGVALDIVFPRNMGRWSVNNELQWFSWDVSDENFDYFHSDDLYLKRVYDFSFSYLKMNNMLRYSFPVGKFTLFVNAGISNGYAVIYTNHQEIVRKEFTLIETSEWDYVADIRRYEQAWLLGGGIGYGKYFLEYRHEKGNGMSINTEIYSSSHRNFIWVGYRF
ncbi:MAG: hypothetical protein RBT02_00575 [Bacteroidales bacterium]|nr:hypothetical protein [Bacteroidales bacterium]